MGRFVKREERVVGAPVSYKPEGKDRSFADRCPACVEYLTVEAHDDGSARQRSTVTVLWEAGVWKLCLNDRENARSLWVAAETLVEAWEALEQGLDCVSPAWRYWPVQATQAKNRRRGP